DGNVGEIAVPIKDILYIQGDKHYLYYYRINDPVPLRERAMLATKEEALQGYDFFKPHRRFLVNMKYVNRFDLVLHAMTMVNGANIPISKALREEAFEAYKNFMRR
ncbi:MAG: LytTR family transcriptional regulator DNA-binding domain-containing protein, partial [Clostridia bacterium]|nr:LytTR family transcriptional regulator DNA-binding domain-containing protein [Clostridia bacterium]